MSSPRMTDAEIWDCVTEAHTGIFVTLRRDGIPIAMPMWFACLDRHVYMQTRGRKLQRIGNDPRAAFLVESGERWADLKAVHLTGTAELIDPDDDLAARFGAEIDRKYAAFRAAASEMPTETAEYYRTRLRGLVRFTPDDRILNWDNAKLTS